MGLRRVNSMKMDMLRNNNVISPKVKRARFKNFRNSEILGSQRKGQKVKYNPEFRFFISFFFYLTITKVSQLKCYYFCLLLLLWPSLIFIASKNADFKYILQGRIKILLLKSTLTLTHQTRSKSP